MSSHFSIYYSFTNVCFISKLSVDNDFIYIMFELCSVSVSKTFLPCLEAVCGVWSAIVRHNKKHTRDEQVTLTPESAKHLVEAIIIYFSLTVASNNKHLVRRSTTAVIPLWSDEECLVAFSKVSGRFINPRLY